MDAIDDIAKKISPPYSRPMTAVLRAFFAVTLALVVQTSLLTQSAFAHELLPEEIIELMKTNPNLTEEDIDAYVKDRDAALHKIEAIQSANLDDSSFIQVVLNFMKLGIQHILEGLDHALFVLSLLLVFANLKHILKLVTAFTIAHSITFIIAGLGILVVPPRIVEPLIALSIAYVALTTVFLRHHRWFGNVTNKLASVFFFGLFHGLGFAGLLTDLHIPDGRFLTSLISFNIGIEFGQFIILALALPYIYLLRHKEWYPTFIKIVAIVISQIAVIWAIERIFAVSIITA